MLKKPDFIKKLGNSLALFLLQQGIKYEYRHYGSRKVGAMLKFIPALLKDSRFQLLELCPLTVSVPRQELRYEFSSHGPDIYPMKRAGGYQALDITFEEYVSVYRELPIEGLVVSGISFKIYDHSTFYAQPPEDILNFLYNPLGKDPKPIKVHYRLSMDLHRV